MVSGWSRINLPSDARANQLTSIVLESSKLPALQNLYLAGNQLVELELDGFTELRDVDLGGNALQTLVLRNLPKITTVYSSDVYLRGNPLRNFTAVKPSGIDYLAYR